MDLTQQLPNQPKTEPQIMASQPKVAEVSNSSGATVPDEVKGLSWGGFFLSWIWGVANGVWLSLLVFVVPFWHFVLLFKGREWAWKGKRWTSIEEFKKTQKTWAIVGLVLNFGLVPVYIGLMSISILATINPVEQTNKARDAKYRMDSAEILAASERYYNNNGKYPFVLSGEKVDVATFIDALIKDEDLKSSFAGKEMMVSEKPVDKMYLVGTNDSYKVCFTPKATSNKNLGQEMCVP